ncbi:MAG: DHH family phosphoesterase [Chloroflexi bacterium]|nr:DHH family phosphoesterase [Chloroflexota bacterium]
MTLDRKWQIAEPPPPGFRLDLGALGSGIRGPLAARLLWNRGIRTDSDVASYFSSGLGDLLDPLGLPDMADAVDRIYRAIKDGETIGVFGDFDVDGLTGTAIVIRIVRKLGGEAIPYIPNRETDGHGLSIRAIDSFQSAGLTLIITVDTGSTAVDEIAHAKRLGIDTVVTDHHLIETGRPDAWQSSTLTPARTSVNRSTIRALGSRSNWRKRCPTLRGAKPLPSCCRSPPWAPSPTSCRWFPRTGLWCAKGCACSGRPSSPGFVHCSTFPGLPALPEGRRQS